MTNREESLKHWIRPQVREIIPYAPEPSGPRIRLDANETPWDVPESLKHEIWETVLQQAWNRYPDPECRQLREIIAELEAVPVDQVLVGNGSDEIIRDLLIGFGGPGTQTIIPVPTFSMYQQLTLAVGGEVVKVPLQSKDWGMNTTGMINALAAEKARIAFVASPNNPTGGVYSRRQLEVLLQATDRLVVVDEAYRWFAEESLVRLLPVYPNLVVLGTLSKTCSLAGLRVGYVLAHPLVIETLKRVRLPYNLDGVAQIAAAVVLRHRDFWQRNVQTVIQERKILNAGLCQHPALEVFASQANFILIRYARANDLRLALAQQDIAVRGFAGTMELADCLRITVGTPEENQRLLLAVKKALG